MYLRELIQIKLIKKLASDHLFDVSIWLSSRGYTLYDDYYKLKTNTNIMGTLCDIWLLNVRTGYAIIVQINTPHTILVVDLEDTRGVMNDIVYYLETGDQPKDIEHKIEIVQPTYLSEYYAN